MIIEVPTRNVLELYAEIDRTRSEIGRLRAVLEGVLEHADAKRDADCSDDVRVLLCAIYVASTTGTKRTQRRSSTKLSTCLRRCVSRM